MGCTKTGSGPWFANLSPGLDLVRQCFFQDDRWKLKTIATGLLRQLCNYIQWPATDFYFQGISKHDLFTTDPHPTTPCTPSWFPGAQSALQWSAGFSSRLQTPLLQESVPCQEQSSSASHWKMLPRFRRIKMWDSVTLRIDQMRYTFLMFSFIKASSFFQREHQHRRQLVSW